MKPWYRELFENYAETYDKEEFTRGTAGEADFFEQEINFDRAREILDIGCGTGRHAIELAKRGYYVTGIDLSDSQLKKAWEKAVAEKAQVKFLRLDACELPFHRQFDLAIMLCEGGFPLMETDELNFRILEGAARALKSPGKLILTTLNALFPLRRPAQVPAGDERFSENRFDLMTFRQHSTLTVTDDSGTKKTLRCDERFYAPSEIRWLLSS
ncbi:MAG: class I SAM-dependent methyltransferase, partial [Endomicrobiales bacterium]